MRNIITAALLLLGLAVLSSAADAYTCTTNCYTIGNQQQCNTYCF
jgi:hypothetical protein